MAWRDGAAEPRALVRADGSVVVPPALAAGVLRVLLRDLGARVAVDGGELAPGVHRLLWSLHVASSAVEDEPDGSGDGTPSEGPASVEISTADAARVLGCSEGYVRRLARAGRLRGRKVGPVWLVAEAAIVAPGSEEAA
ncbi:helix-turn-helix domain-containing protein [Streptomyces sp. NPDC091212]|uniref:helix-turn-helix domain-containing protein n=1 Tax=Streptomyces sp. NPDC091212 TaxID=3155191 RepID=UPI003446F98C